jgi:hypothetical protein
MIGLLLLGFLIVLVCSSWLLMRKIASLRARWQFCVAAPSVCLILLVPVQFISGYSLASVWGPLIVIAVACFANVLLMFLLWHRSRDAFVVGLMISLSFWAGSFIGCLVLLAGLVGNSSTILAAEGRISPIASYRVVQYPGIWGGATQTYTYEIYENPRWLPLVWKKVIHDTVPCGKGFDAGGFLIGAGANDHMVVISCKGPEPGFSSNQIPIG